MGIDAGEGHVGQISIDGEHLVRLPGQKPSVPHAGVHLDVGLHHGGAALRQAVEGQPRVHRPDGAHRVQVHQPLQLLPVGGGAEHEDLLLHQPRLPQVLRRLGGAHRKAADALVPQQLRHLHQARAVGVPSEGGVDHRAAGALLDHRHVLLDRLFLYHQGLHGFPAFPALIDWYLETLYLFQ